MDLHLKQELLPENACLIIGVSGGMDSMCLIHALKRQRPDLKLIAVHLNHQLRESAKEDEVLVQKIMREWAIPLEIQRVQAPKSGNLEDWGRRARYAFFEACRAKYQAQYIVTAHHQNDDFESFLLHFLRGTRVKGQSGMKLQRGNIIRPLLFTEKVQIQEYAKTHEISYLEDPSNQNTDFKRNQIRLELVPKLLEIEPSLRKKWQKQKSYWLALDDFLKKQAESFLNDQEPNQIDRKRYREQELPLRYAILEAWYQKSSGKQIQDQNQLERWDEAILCWHSGKKTEWDQSVFLTIQKDIVRLD